ncbi:TolC family protein [Myroides odoratus]|uniref:TolC family protein n=1 Tax=Myroides odoratus TaxID=256 RepID=UPI001E33C128|nr:TolC family protein [Myroides odoratus]WQD59404.1 TolC family protein [Myroides odoratus]
MEKNRLIKVLSQANNDLVASKEKLKSAYSALLFAQKSFEADQLKYEYGKISLTELLLTQKDYFNSQGELIKAKYEYVYNKGVIRFYRTSIFFF